MAAVVTGTPVFGLPFAPMNGQASLFAGFGDGAVSSSSSEESIPPRQIDVAEPLALWNQGGSQSDAASTDRGFSFQRRLAGKKRERPPELRGLLKKPAKKLTQAQRLFPVEQPEKKAERPKKRAHIEFNLPSASSSYESYYETDEDDEVEIDPPEQTAISEPEPVEDPMEADVASEIPPVEEADSSSSYESYYETESDEEVEAVPEPVPAPDPSPAASPEKTASPPPEEKVEEPTSTALTVYTGPEDCEEDELDLIGIGMAFTDAHETDAPKANTKEVDVVLNLARKLAEDRASGDEESDIDMDVYDDDDDDSGDQGNDSGSDDVTPYPGDRDPMRVPKNGKSNDDSLSEDESDVDNLPLSKGGELHDEDYQEQMSHPPPTQSAPASAGAASSAPPVPAQPAEGSAPWSQPMNHNPAGAAMDVPEGMEELIREIGTGGGNAPNGPSINITNNYGMPPPPEEDVMVDYSYLKNIYDELTDEEEEIRRVKKRFPNARIITSQNPYGDADEHTHGDCHGHDDPAVEPLDDVDEDDVLDGVEVVPDDVDDDDTNDTHDESFTHPVYGDNTVREKMTPKGVAPGLLQRKRAARERRALDGMRFTLNRRGEILSDSTHASDDYEMGISDPEETNVFVRGKHTKKDKSAEDEATVEEQVASLGTIYIDCPPCLSDTAVRDHVTKDLQKAAVTTILSVDLKMASKIMQKLYMVKIVLPQIQQKMPVQPFCSRGWFRHFLHTKEKPVVLAIEMEMTTYLYNTLETKVMKEQTGEGKIPVLPVMKEFDKLSKKKLDLADKIAAMKLGAENRKDGSDIISSLRPYLRNAKEQATSQDRGDLIRKLGV